MGRDGSRGDVVIISWGLSILPLCLSVMWKKSTHICYTIYLCITTHIFHCHWWHDNVNTNARTRSRILSAFAYDLRTRHCEYTQSFGKVLRSVATQEQHSALLPALTCDVRWLRLWTFTQHTYTRRRTQSSVDKSTYGYANSITSMATNASTVYAICGITKPHDRIRQNV